MPHNRNHILDAIGNTPLVELRNIVPKGSARIVGKLKFLTVVGYQLLTCVKFYVAAMEKSLGKAYAEPTADVTPTSRVEVVATKVPSSGLRPPSPILRTGEGKTFKDYRLLPCLLAWEKVPDRADEGILITSASFVSFTRVAFKSLRKRTRVQFKQVIVIIVEID